MIDRKTYLEMCRQNAMKSKSKGAKYKGIVYYPHQYQLGFAVDGKILHTAVMLDDQRRIFYCNLKDIEEF